jgi:histidine triad (HIT) family protein
VSSHCLFCRIVERAISSKIVYEDEQVMAFDDINPQAPIHALVIPKRHIGSLDEIQETDRALLGHLLTTCANIAKQKGLARTGYRVVANTGAEGGQTVSHLHLHVLGGRPMKWPPG